MSGDSGSLTVLRGEQSQTHEAWDGNSQLIVVIPSRHAASLPAAGRGFACPVVLLKLWFSRGDWSDSQKHSFNKLLKTNEYVAEKRNSELAAEAASGRAAR